MSLLPMDDEPVEPPAAQTDQTATVTNINDIAERRRALVAVAERKPDDVAKVLSGWLRTRES
jgi:hypothetical protein